MALYEEKVSSRGFRIFLILAALPMLFGLYATYMAGEGFEFMLITALLVVLVLVDAMELRIEIDEREVRIRGPIGLITRKTVRIENIASFSVAEGWMSCSGAVHFSLPAKGCVMLRQKKGWTVSFTTNHPEEVARILAMLGVPREP
ncbi:hypothetical protein [Thermococcus gorgonarius]|uniref:DUF304 domain-containing protein n=1 Tax=Thermococcus gorgonarius TaxID=71997 RepID=A0A2Z2MEY6_THEGO|nr:hypothetical protein [Thermococcus gorgonarius]ASJ00568.1 hypothetical protein A3K92_03300 [Thermococcus gorgonarius]